MTPIQIIAAMDAALKIIELLQTAASKARERGEWTAEQEAEFDAKRRAIWAQPHMQPKG